MKKIEKIKGWYVYIEDRWVDNAPEIFEVLRTLENKINELVDRVNEEKNGSTAG